MSDPAPRADDLKARIAATIRDRRDSILEVSRALHAAPETAWHEHASAALLADELERLGMTVARSAGGLETAFVASAGSGARTVAVVAEYDALAGLGHACGHNIIAAAAVGAAAALVPLAGALDAVVQVIGTPAEEGGGGKIHLLEAGVFDDVELAMMIHPGPADALFARPLAVAHFDVEYTGRASHASAYPTLGINAADAFTVAQVAIGLLRQHLPPSVRVHGVVREAGTAPNAVPGSSLGSWYVRAATLEELETAFRRVTACFEAGALATGCSIDIRETSPRYSEFRTDDALAASFAANAAAIGRDMDADESRPPGMNTASTDMGNVSRRIRALHPYLGIDSAPAVNHQAEFAEATVRPAGDRAALDGALLLAQTIVDALLDPPHPDPLDLDQETAHAHAR